MYQIRRFTLIELLVAALIIGILVRVAFPQYQTVVAKARFSEYVQQAFAIRRLQELYWLANGIYAFSWEDLSADIVGNCMRI